MEGLFVIIAVIIGIANFMQKQNQSRGRDGTKRQQSQYRQKPVRMQKHVLPPPQKTFIDVERGWSRMPKDAEKGEGIEAEDRSRTGSLDYTEQNRDYESLSYRPIKPEPKGRTENKAVTKAGIIEENNVFDLTEENLLRSIVMAEVLGPPRAMKRRIR